MTMTTTNMLCLLHLPIQSFLLDHLSMYNLSSWVLKILGCNNSWWHEEGQYGRVSHNQFSIRLYMFFLVATQSHHTRLSLIHMWYSYNFEWHWYDWRVHMWKCYPDLLVHGAQRYLEIQYESIDMLYDTP